jgi:hypothetical protein
MLREPQSPDNERITQSESMLLMEFQSFWIPSRYAPVQFRTCFPPPFAIAVYDAPHLSPRSSNLYRNAILVLMSFLRGNDALKQYHYLGKYRIEVQKCIDQGSFLEATLASYLIAVYFLIEGSSMQSALKSSCQFCSSLVALVRKEKQMDHWIELLWNVLLSSVYYVHRDSILFGYSDTGAGASLIRSFEQWEELVGISYSLLPSEEDIANLPRSMSIAETCHKVESVSIYLQFYLDQYLFRTMYSEDVQEINLVRQRLYIISDKITRLIAHLPYISDYIHHAYDLEPNSNATYDPEANMFLHFPSVRPRGLRPTMDPEPQDTAVALLYAFAHLMKTMLEPTADIDEKLISEVDRSAIAICRLCASFPSQSRMVTLLIKRSLFWAGLILTPSKLPPGQCLSFPF